MKKYFIEESEKYHYDIVRFDDIYLNRLLMFFLYKTHKSSTLNENNDIDLYNSLYEEMYSLWCKDINANYIHIIDKSAGDKKTIFDMYGFGSKKYNYNYKKIVIVADTTDVIENTKYDYLTLVRHLRNSIAHGNVYYNKQNNVLLFCDYNGRNNLTAKIICTKKDLIGWRQIIKRSRTSNI